MDVGNHCAAVRVREPRIGEQLLVSKWRQFRAVLEIGCGNDRVGKESLPERARVNPVGKEEVRLIVAGGAAERDVEPADREWRGAFPQVQQLKHIHHRHAAAMGDGDDLGIGCLNGGGDLGLLRGVRVSERRSEW